MMIFLLPLLWLIFSPYNNEEAVMLTLKNTDLTQVAGGYSFAVITEVVDLEGIPNACVDVLKNFVNLSNPTQSDAEQFFETLGKCGNNKDVELLFDRLNGAMPYSMQVA
jgi:hypothetical protein